MEINQVDKTVTFPSCEVNKKNSRLVYCLFRQDMYNKRKKKQ